MTIVVQYGMIVLVSTTFYTHGLDMYPDYTETNVDGSLEVSEDGVLNDAKTIYDFWHHSTEPYGLSPPFRDKSLVGNCTGTSAIACTGCRRVRVCIPGIRDETMLPEVNCPSSTYCHTLAFDMGGACLATIDPQFPECRGTADIGAGNGVNSHICTGLGLFPNPLDCRRYILCAVVGSYGQNFKCPSGYTYNSRKRSCSRRKPCRQIQCRPNWPSYFVRHPLDPAYYAYCNYSRRESTHFLNNVRMYKCEEGTEFNELVNGCVHKCTHEGFFPKPGDAFKYYWCRKLNGQLLGYEQVCQWPGFTFDPMLGICTASPSTPTPVPTLLSSSTTPHEISSLVKSSIANTSASTTTPQTPSNLFATDTNVQLPPWSQWASLLAPRRNKL